MGKNKGPDKVTHEAEKNAAKSYEKQRRNKATILKGGLEYIGYGSSREEAEKNAVKSYEKDRRILRMSLEMEDEKADLISKSIYNINNAGLVLTGQFLPHLFQSLDMLYQDETAHTGLRGSKAVSHAVRLLQYLVDGRTDAPEPLLALNKIMCGVPPVTQVERAIESTEQERERCEQLLKAMIANWKIISNTSIAGLRDAFLQREGKLERTPDGWKLQVQRKTLDVLVDQIPWSISVIFNKWMPQPLRVTW